MLGWVKVLLTRMPSAVAALPDASSTNAYAIGMIDEHMTTVRHRSAHSRDRIRANGSAKTAAKDVIARNPLKAFINGSGELITEAKPAIRNPAHGKIAELIKTGLSRQNSKARTMTSAFIAAPRPIPPPSAWVSPNRGSHDDRTRRTASTARRMPMANAMPNEATPSATPSTTAPRVPISDIIIFFDTTHIQSSQNRSRDNRGPKTVPAT